MAGKSAILSIKILSDAKNAQKGMDGAASSIGKVEGAAKRAAVPAAAALAGVAALGKGMIDAGEAAGTSNARIGNIAESMGVFGDEHAAIAAGVVKDAEKMAKSTGIDPNAIKQGQAALLTFGEVAKSAGEMGGTFDRATAASADLSAAGFGSVESASVMLGKALNDPVKGMSALSRVGVTFTEQQKEQIAAMQESGDAAGAQAIILQSVEQQVGGTAAATANATDKMKVGWQLATEQLGTALMPALDQVSAAMIGLTSFVAANSTAVLVAVGIIGGLSAAVLLVNLGFKAWAVATKVAAAGQLLLNVAMSANPIGIVVIALAALVAGIVWAYKNVDSFRAGVDAAWSGIQSVTASVFGAVGKWISDLVGNAQRGWAILQAATGAAFNAVSNGINSAITTARSTVYAGTSAIGSAFNSARNTIGGAINSARNTVSGATNAIGSAFSSVGSRISGVMSSARSTVASAVGSIGSAFSGIRGTVMGALSGAGSWLVGAGRNIVDGLIGGVTSMASRIGSFFLSAVPGWIRGPFKKALGIASPSKVFEKFGINTGEGFIVGTKKMAGRVGSAAKNMLKLPSVDLSLSGGSPGVGSDQARGRAGGTTINITVNGALDPPAVAEQIKRVLTGASRRAGITVNGQPAW